jgi:hypothetical protein
MVTNSETINSNRCTVSRPLFRIVLQVAAAAARELARTGWSEARSFIDDKSSGVLIENFQQAVDAHERQLIDEQEITRSRPVDRPID